MKVKVVALPVETWDEILRRIEGSDEYAALDFALGKTEEIESPEYGEFLKSENSPLVEHYRNTAIGPSEPKEFAEFVQRVKLKPSAAEEEYKLGTSKVLEGPNIGRTDASPLNSSMAPAIIPEGFDEALEEVVKTLESPVEWIQVKSSNLSAVAYQEDLQLLLVEFKKGEVYKYAGVPKGVFESLMSADSKGRFFAANIKDHFPAERLEVKREQD